jgi:hypothetical protein
MTKRNLMILTIGIAALILSADTAMAQKKKQPQAAGRASFKECCEKAYARYYIDGGKGGCSMISEQQKDSFYQCVHNGGVGIISKGQSAF